MPKPGADPSSGMSLGDALRLPKRHPADAPHGAPDILDDVGTGERAPQFLLQSKSRDGEDLVNAFHDRAEDPGPVSFEALGEVAATITILS